MPISFAGVALRSVVIVDFNQGGNLRYNRTYSTLDGRTGFVAFKFRRPYLGEVSQGKL